MSGLSQSQTWEDWEAVLVNDGSTDHSLNIARKRAAQDPRIRVFSYPNAGISVTRNRLLSHAQEMPLSLWTAMTGLTRRCWNTWPGS